jgi:hypothetical protein
LGIPARELGMAFESLHELRFGRVQPEKGWSCFLLQSFARNRQKDFRYNHSRKLSKLKLNFNLQFKAA